MNELLRDIRYATRSLLRAPGFFALAVVTLGLGIGATTALFSVVNGVLLRPLPYPNADRVVQVWEVDADRGMMQMADANFADLREQARSLAGLAEVSERGVVSVVGGIEPVRVRAADVSRDFFTVLGLGAERGRFFAREEQQVGASPAVVVSHAFWQRYLGGRPSLTGLTLTFSDRVYAIVGVAPPALDFPAGIDLWTPRELDAPLTSRTAHNWEAIGLLRDATTIEVARAEVSAVARRLKQQYGKDTWAVDMALIPLREQLVGRVRPTLLVMLAASAVLLAIACANVVNLLVARSSARRGELALRLALGAGRARLARQFVAEALVLSSAGGILGLGLAQAGVRALVAFEPGNLPRLGEVHVNLPAMLFTLGIAVGSAMVLGLFTAWLGVRGDLREALASGQRTQAGVGSNHRVRSALVIAQVAMTVVLLVGAGLLGRSFMRVLDVNPGFHADRAVVLDLSVGSARDDNGTKQIARFYDDLISQLGAIPGVRNVGAVDAFPLTGRSPGNGVFIIMSTPDERLDMAKLPQLMQDTSRVGQAEFRLASGGYFRAMNIPLVRGRLFDDRDAPDAPHVAVISASLAKMRWPNGDAIGKIIQFGNMDGDLRTFTIVGVVGDVREASLSSSPRPTFYAFYRQRPRRAASMNIVIAGAGAPASVISVAERIVRALRPDVLPRFRTIDAVVSRSVADRRFVLLLVGVFGGAALFLAALGIYSVMSYLVTQRRREIGIRVALGAQRDQVLSLVVSQGAGLALIGVAIGAGTAMLLTRVLADLLFEVSATDPVSFAAVIFGLVSVALAASYVPALRATRVQPMTVLRGE